MYTYNAWFNVTRIPLLFGLRWFRTVLHPELVELFGSEACNHELLVVFQGDCRCWIFFEKFLQSFVEMRFMTKNGRFSIDHHHFHRYPRPIRTIPSTEKFSGICIVRLEIETMFNTSTVSCKWKLFSSIVGRIFAAPQHIRPAFNWIFLWIIPMFALHWWRRTRNYLPLLRVLCVLLPPK